ncbi:cation-dependent mannose-6-phosphate receptor-like [Oncorhynchus keta]|uniref:cation-dependent mannose-6-phosphate receptor-like n=1 Tax=Oncorhynchus keta TaxID=8018 RepID=UPI00227BDA23|nr:cation-dependent mannose-6-phosphate receptor-like [Oncorhynchus keta]
MKVSMSTPHTATSGRLLVLAVQLVLLVCGSQASDDTKRCKLFSESPAERKVLSLLEPLTNKTFSVATTSGKESYTYQFQVCGDAGKMVGAGLVQIDHTEKESETVLGLYTATQAIGGSDWVMLIYSNGTKYDGHCSKEMRKAIVMISCNRGVEMGKLEVVLEERERDRDCFYLFELDSSARLIVGAKGLQQFPNYVFWTQVGNLAADGCNFVCRTQGPEEVPPTYRGVSTEPKEQPEERDDHLLPM